MAVSIIILIVYAERLAGSMAIIIVYYMHVWRVHVHVHVGF